MPHKGTEESMTKLIQAFLMTALLASAGAFVGCGQSETDVNGDTTADGNDSAGSANCTTPTCGAMPGPSADAGSSAPAPDADAPAPDAGTPPAQPAPVASPGACRLEFSDAYIGGSACGEIRGAIPGATWSSGPSIEDGDADHFLSYAPSSVAPGTYELTYVVKTCGGSVGTWADYGSRSQLLGMTPDARSFVNCNWWDVASGTTISVASHGCNLRITVDGACAITGAGNMRDYR